MTPSPRQDVLIVEDEPIIRIMVADTLSDIGITAWEAESAEEALLLLEDRPDIGLVFTDVNLAGGMNGLELSHEVTLRRPDISIVVTSGAALVSAEELPPHGAFIAKPYQSQRLLGMIAEKLGRSTDPVEPVPPMGPGRPR